EPFSLLGDYQNRLLKPLEISECLTQTGEILPPLLAGWFKLEPISDSCRRIAEYEIWLWPIGRRCDYDIAPKDAGPRGLAFDCEVAHLSGCTNSHFVVGQSKD